jgi:hypothetical protein
MIVCIRSNSVFQTLIGSLAQWVRRKQWKWCQISRFRHADVSRKFPDWRFLDENRRFVVFSHVFLVDTLDRKKCYSLQHKISSDQLVIIDIVVWCLKDQASEIDNSTS